VDEHRRGLGLWLLPLPDRRPQHRHPGLDHPDLRKGKFDNDKLEEQLNKRGLMNRLLGGFARRINTPWKIYPVGVLFGLGFDTATEVALSCCRERP
jgi:hypothetical protein